MRERIRKLLRWLDARLIGDDDTFPVWRGTDGTVLAGERPTMEIIFSNLIETGPPAHVSERERFTIAAFRRAVEDDDTDGRPGYWLDLKFRDPRNGDRWQPMLMMPGSKLPVVRDAIDDMLAFLNPPAQPAVADTALASVHGASCLIQIVGDAGRESSAKPSPEVLIAFDLRQPLPAGDWGGVLTLPPGCHEALRALIDLANEQAQATEVD